LTEKTQTFHVAYLPSTDICTTIFQGDTHLEQTGRHWLTE